MTLHLRVLNGEEQVIITDLIALCGGENVKTEYYGDVFVSIEIETSWRSGFGAIFSEGHYREGDYRISLFKVNNHAEEVIIPLKFIDCIYGL